MKNIDTNFTSDLDYLDNHYKRLMEYKDNIKKELPINKLVTKRKIGKHLSLVKFSDLNNNWNTSDISSNLKALANKIVRMIEKGGSPNVRPMLVAISQNNIKSLKSPTCGSLGKGHFRWNWKAYTLNESEIKRVKEFFNL